LEYRKKRNGYIKISSSFQTPPLAKRLKGRASNS